MVTLGEIKQDYKEVTDLMANYTFSLESIKELNDHLCRTGHKTLIEINGEPIDEIKSIKDSEIKWVRLDDYNNLSYIYFNKDWQTNVTEEVMFDAYIGVGGDDYFIQDLKINELDSRYLEYVEYEKAKKYIADYLQSEYSSEADFSNLFHIGIGYTEIGSEEQGDFSFQVEANLVDCEINYYIDGEIAKTEKYDSMAEMNECRLSCLDFEEFLHIGTTELDRILEEKEKAAPVKVVLAVSQYDTNRYYIANNATEAAVRNIISNSDKIFMDLCALGGKQIDEATFAKYSQTEGITAIDVNIDEQIMNVYDAEKPITTFDDIRSNKIRQSDFINQLDEVIATCQKMKEALINGEVDLDRDQRSVGQER